LNKLKEKRKAYVDINDYLCQLIADKEKSIHYREAANGVLKSITNMERMVRMGIEMVRHDLEELS